RRDRHRGRRPAPVDRRRGAAETGREPRVRGGDRPMALTIGVDVGGTKVAAGVVDEGGQILEKVRRPTPSTNPQETAEVIAEVVELLRGKYEDVVAVGLGAAGFVDETRSTVLFAPNLAWRGEPIQEKVERRVGRPIGVRN